MISLPKVRQTNRGQATTNRRQATDRWTQSTVKSPRIIANTFPPVEATEPSGTLKFLSQIQIRSGQCNAQVVELPIVGDRVMTVGPAEVLQEANDQAVATKTIR
ncbi:MAG: hypothetical protein ACI814_004685 [Mariniblastus sp.]|jgi:hypothetical protein